MSILTDISENLQRGKAKIVKELVQQAIDEGIPVQQILDEGLLSGMGVIGEKFKNNEVFVPEVLVAARAMNKGAQAIVGYNENVAFHPDGSKYFTCYGTAVLFEYDPADPESLPLMLQQRFRERDQRVNEDMI